VDNTRGYARVSHTRQWSNYNFVGPGDMEQPSRRTEDFISVYRDTCN